MMKAQSSISLHIIGTYSTKQKKHIAKDERTKIELDNVFIKVMNHNLETYLQKLTCDLTKSEGENI